MPRKSIAASLPEDDYSEDQDLLPTSQSSDNTSTANEINLKVQRVEEQLLDLKRQQEEIERQKKELDELSRKQREFDEGRARAGDGKATQQRGARIHCVSLSAPIAWPIAVNLLVSVVLSVM